MEVSFTIYMYIYFFLAIIASALSEFSSVTNYFRRQTIRNRTESNFGIAGRDFEILQHVSLHVIFHARLNTNASLCIKCGKKTLSAYKVNLV